MRRGRAAPAAPVLHPVSALTHVGALVLFLLLYAHPVLLLVLALLPGLTLAARGEVRAWRRQLAWGLTLALFILAFNGLFGGVGSTELFSFFLPFIGRRTIFLERLVYGVAMALRLAGIIGAFALADRLVDLERLLYFSPLAGRSSLTAALTLGLISRLNRSARTLLEVQASRGAPLAAGGLRRGIRAAGPLLAALTETALEDSLDMAEVLTARGYGSGRPTNFRPERWHLRDSLILLGTVSALACGLEGVRAGATSFTHYPALVAPAWADFLPVLAGVFGGLGVPAFIFWGWRHCRWLRVNV
ncbi:MAG: energy-coupling factor transport system permease protein [Bacillota bacterium]|nr:energy-coupling factor transport system permease protein [Bacillota bacterium]